MAEESETHRKEPIDKDPSFPLRDDQPSKQEESAAATSKSESVVVKLSSRIKRYPKKDFKEQTIEGSGGYGDVRKYRHNDKIVVIKEFAIKADDETKNEIWNKVASEANALSRLRHENIVKILGITQWSNGVGIVMEYVDGGNLQDLLFKSKELPWNTRLQIAKGIVSGLESIHNYGEKKEFCHGDLKPENVLLTKELQVKLADFGSAAFYRATGASATTISHVSTNQFTLVYVAPEFLADTTLRKNPAMDIYSFGMLLYELISRKVPFSDCNVPTMLPALIVNKNKPNKRPIDETKSQLKSDDDRATFSLLKNLMEKCWNDNPALRPTSKTEFSRLLPGAIRHRTLDGVSRASSCRSSVLVEQKQEEKLKYPDREAQNVDAENAANERKHVRAPTRRKIIGRESYAPRPSARQSSVGDDQLPTSFAGMPKQSPPENTPSKKITNKTGIFSPKSPFRAEATSEQINNAPGPPMLFDNKKKVEDYLEIYRKDLLSGNFKAAENCLAALRSFHANDVTATAEDIRLHAVKLQSEEKYLQSVALFDTAAALFAKLKNPADDLERIQHCVQGMKLANQAIVGKDRSTKVIVKEHVIPLMRNWVHEMKGASQVSERWRCHTVSWALSNIEGCELLIGQIDKRKQTLEEAVKGMRKAFGSDVYKPQGRLFGNLLDHLAGVYNDESHFDEAASLYREALKAREEAEDYFGDEEDRKDDIRVTENNLQKNLRDAWKKQMRM